MKKFLNILCILALCVPVINAEDEKIAGEVAQVILRNLEPVVNAPSIGESVSEISKSVKNIGSNMSTIAGHSFSIGAQMCKSTAHFTNWIAESKMRSILASAAIVGTGVTLHRAVPYFYAQSFRKEFEKIVEQGNLRCRMCYDELLNLRERIVKNYPLINNFGQRCTRAAIDNYYNLGYWTGFTGAWLWRKCFHPSMKEIAYVVADIDGALAQYYNNPVRCARHQQ